MVNAQIMPYPLMFDPSQWSNQYSQFNNGPLPWPPQIAGNPWTGRAPQQPGDVGWPTDAMGNPIQVPQGVTLNTSPAAPPAPAPAQPLNMAQYAMNNSIINAMGQQANQFAPATGGFAGSSGGPNLQEMGNVIDMRAQNNAAYNQGGFGPGYWGGPGLQAAVAGTVPPGIINPSMDSQQALAALNAYGAKVGYPGGAGGTGAGGAPAGPSGPAPLNYQQYLALLANPGKPPSYGATVPQAPNAFQPSSGGAIPNFMASFSPATKGPGAGFQQGFAAAMGAPASSGTKKKS